MVPRHPDPTLCVLFSGPKVVDCNVPRVAHAPLCVMLYIVMRLHYLQPNVTSRQPDHASATSRRRRMVERTVAAEGVPKV
jgi:hypothetical protein